MKTKILLIAFITVSLSCFSQSDNDRAMAYYKSAELAFQNKEYSKAISNLELVEDILGKTNARVLNLKMKSYFYKGDYLSAKKCLDKFSSYSSEASENLRNETLSFIPKIEERLNEAKAEEEKRIAAAKAKEEAKRKEEERFYEIKKRLPNEIEEQISKLKSLKEGKIYRFRDTEKLTNSSIEMSYFAFYGDKYIVFTKPEIAVGLELSKDRLGLYDSIFNNKRLTNFQISKKESEVFYNLGSGFDHISSNNNYLSGYDLAGYNLEHASFNGGV